MKYSIPFTRMQVSSVPCILWGRPSDKVYLFVHGKMSDKESAGHFAEIADTMDFQTFSFDLPMHGERANEEDRCDIFNGIRDLTVIADYVFSRFSRVCLYACSLGAYFSLHAYRRRMFENCLFQSPIVDMHHLIQKMMTWYNVSVERLEREKEVDTPIDILSWDYYQYVLSHPIRQWNSPTSILFAGKDDLQSADVMKAFSERFGCRLTVSPGSLHPFMEPADAPVVEKWLKDSMAK